MHSINVLLRMSIRHSTLMEGQTRRSLVSFECGNTIQIWKQGMSALEFLLNAVSLAVDRDQTTLKCLHHCYMPNLQTILADMNCVLTSLPVHV